MHKNSIIIRNLRPETLYFDDKKDVLDIKLVDLSLAIEKEFFIEN